MDQEKTQNRQGTVSRPFIHRLYESPMSGQDIEDSSFAAIDREAPPHNFTEEQWVVVRRMIHTTADFAMSNLVKFSPDAIDSCVEALRRGCKIYTDSNMIRSGLSLARLQSVNPAFCRDDILCHVADADVAAQARDSGLPRSLFAVRKASAHLNGGIVLVGNAPVALLELNRMVVEEGVRPALVIGMPVGFIHVLESKEELVQTGIPYVVLDGRRGGSPLAVSTLHAMCSVAAAQFKGQR